ncbi:site-specific integrase [Salinirubellus salinus]|uniref:Site-specific integrase n=1 Tax=Salinirubellus salinus TaxID=1364945 RepID=A0A9E7R3M2_9EURY|nr:site-specific integrase [Salinirubellus salinus]UWM55190.1 site-specific integrase [Salinirubellus salinus]
MSGPPDDLSPRDVAERWLAKQRVEKTDSTLSTYWYRIKRVVNFCEENGIDRMQDLSAWELDELDAQFRGRGPKKISISKEYRTINNWLEWAVNIGVAQEGLDKVLEPPKTTKKEEVSTERLEPGLAESIIRDYRSQPVGAHRATLIHTLLELMWWSGARIGAIRGLDRGDVDLEEETLEFHHRPDTGTPIKQAYNPERKIGMPSEVMDVLADYIREIREPQIVDEYGREPLLTTPHGRLAESTARRYSNFATVPCRAGPCPHEFEQDSCEFFSLREARGCPSSRSPHAVRTGAISNLRNKGWPLDEVAERVNTSPERIKRHYDFPTLDEQYRERRADWVDRLRLDETEDFDDAE